MKKRGTSRISGLYKKNPKGRLNEIIRWQGTVENSFDAGLTVATAELMVENVIGIFGFPLGVATNFLVNDFDVLVPMAIEEPSVIAAASNAAKMVRAGGGFTAVADPPHTVAQVELLNPGEDSTQKIEQEIPTIIAMANQTQPQLVSLGGGVKEVIVRPGVGSANRTVVHLVVDCRDAMGANMVNTMAESVSGHLAELTGATAGLRILTNLADQRLARAQCKIPFQALARAGYSGEQVAEGVAAAAAFAQADPYRAATHNKGIFNGLDAFLIACGNDWRAVEAGGHAFAAQNGSYRPLSDWQINAGHLEGRIEMPMAVGIVGGASKAHPTARACIELCGIESGAELAEIAMCAGLASNLAALSALSTEGIQKGHMKLHLRKQ